MFVCAATIDFTSQRITFSSIQLSMCSLSFQISYGILVEKKYFRFNQKFVWG